MTFWAIGGVLLLIALLFSGEKRTNTTNSRKEAAHWIYHPHVIEEDDYECSEVLLGISLANEKDLILIVVPTEKKTEMIRQIIQDAGPDTGAVGDRVFPAGDGYGRHDPSSPERGAGGKRPGGSSAFRCIDFQPGPGIIDFDSSRRPREAGAPAWCQRVLMGCGGCRGCRTRWRWGCDPGRSPPHRCRRRDRPGWW